MTCARFVAERWCGCAPRTSSRATAFSPSRSHCENAGRDRVEVDLWICAGRVVTVQLGGHRAADRSGPVRPAAGRRSHHDREHPTRSGPPSERPRDTPLAAAGSANSMLSVGLTAGNYWHAYSASSSRPRSPTAEIRLAPSLSWRIPATPGDAMTDSAWSNPRASRTVACRRAARFVHGQCLTGSSANTGPGAARIVSGKDPQEVTVH